MDLDDLLARLRILASDGLGLLPEWLREPPGSFMAAGALLFLVFYFVIWYFVLRRHRDPASRKLLREIRQAQRAGDALGVGQRWETLGEIKKALSTYQSAGLVAESARLLVDLGAREEAKRAAREGEAWEIYGDLSREDEHFEEAATAYERAGKLYDAARAWESAGRRFKAAQCYAAVGLEANALPLLMDQEGGVTAALLEKVIRASASGVPGASLAPDLAKAVRRCARLWLAQGEAERAYRLAVDCGEWALAVPIARDHLDPDPQEIEVCVRAGAYLVAAHIAAKLGDARREAWLRGEHHRRRDEHAEAAGWFEEAEAWSEAADQWAAAGEIERAAEIFVRGEEYEQAAQLYAAAGDMDRMQAMRDAARARDRGPFTK